MVFNLFLVVAFATTMIERVSLESHFYDGSTVDWERAVKELGHDKNIVCKSIIDENFSKDRAMIFKMYELALDNIGTVVNYSVLAETAIDDKIIQNFDENGKKFVLAISESRKEFKKRYNEAVGSELDESKKEELIKLTLDESFKKACNYLIDSFNCRDTMDLAINRKSQTASKVK